MMNNRTRDLLNALQNVTSPTAPPSPIFQPAESRATSAEWLTLFLAEHGPTPIGEVMDAAMKAGFAPEALGLAATDMGCQLDLPVGVRELLVESGQP